MLNNFKKKHQALKRLETKLCSGTDLWLSGQGPCATFCNRRRCLFYSLPHLKLKHTCGLNLMKMLWKHIKHNVQRLKVLECG